MMRKRNQGHPSQTCPVSTTTTGRRKSRHPEQEREGIRRRTRAEAEPETCYEQGSIEHWALGIILVEIQPDLSDLGGFNNRGKDTVVEEGENHRVVTRSLPEHTMNCR